MANTPIIPGVPTPINGDPTCALTLCGKIIAQVDCIIVIMQGTDGCIDIQFFGKDGTLLDLTNYTSLQIMLYNEFDCTVANFWWPDIPTGCKGFLMTILQYTDAKGIIHNKGKVRICLSAACTKSMSPSSIFAEILLTDLATGGTAEAAARLVEISNAKVASFIFVINLFDLGGSDNLIKNNYKVENLIDFPGH